MGWVRICYKLSLQQILQNNDESIFENNTSRAKFNTLPALDRCCFQILTLYYFVGFAANLVCSKSLPTLKIKKITLLMK